MRDYPAVTDFEAEARMAESEAGKAPDGSATKAGWLHVASSWRLLAERAIAERTGGELSLYTLH